MIDPIDKASLTTQPGLPMQLVASLFPRLTLLLSAMPTQKCLYLHTQKKAVCTSSNRILFPAASVALKANSFPNTHHTGSQLVYFLLVWKVHLQSSEV